jgi:GTP cyclohydrolase II
MEPETLVLTEVADPAGDPAAVRAVERAIGDLRRGEPVLLHGAGAAALVLAAESVRDESLARMALAGGKRPNLLLTGRRAAALGLSPDVPVVAVDAATLSSQAISALAGPTQGESPVGLAAQPVLPALAEAAIGIVKLARLLPSAVIMPLAKLGAGPHVAALAAANDLLAVGEDQIEAYREAGSSLLTRIVETRLPLAGAEQTRVVAYRPGDGGKPHLALVIGDPKPCDSVLVRIHSECFTGDLLGSLRCDCGDQLRGAITAIAEEGAGVLLYLSQEGRGIGLVNKLRAYEVQDGGADTAQANEALGFDADERVYVPAARMLQHLGFPHVRLLTNNPGKVAALAQSGIAVEERVPHVFPANGHNDFYLATKAARFGHKF